MVKVNHVQLVNESILRDTGLRLERGHTVEMAGVGAFSPHLLRCRTIHGRIDNPDRPRSRQFANTFAVLLINNDKNTISGSHSRKDTSVRDCWREQAIYPPIPKRILPCLRLQLHPAAYFTNASLFTKYGIFA